MQESLSRIAPTPDPPSSQAWEEEGDAGAGAFDRVPDEISLHILNRVADVRSLSKCRCVNRRFASLVPQVENLLIKVDAVVPSQSEDVQILSLVHRLLNCVLSTIASFFLSAVASSPPPSPKPTASKSPAPASRPSSSPSALLCMFERIRNLQIELPGGDLKMAEKGAVLRWRAEFGKTLRNCVILASRRMTTTTGKEGSERGEQGEALAVEDGLKERVIWTIGALIAASARHHMVGDVVRGDRGIGIDSLMVGDRDGEGKLVIDKEGIKEWREEEAADEGGGGGEEDVLRKGRTTLPAMRMWMRHQKRLELGDGAAMEGAVLVVARVAVGGGGEEEEKDDEVRLVRGAFGGVFRCAAEQLMKKPSYVLDMNSF